MKFAMYTSALAITVALAGCSSSSSIPSQGPGPTPTPPTPPTPPAAHSTTNTYDNGSDKRTRDLTRATAELPNSTGAGTRPLEEAALATTLGNQTKAEEYRAELAGLGPVLDTPIKVADANAVLTKYNILGHHNFGGTYVLNDSTSGALAFMDGDLTGPVKQAVNAADTSLTNAYIFDQVGSWNPGPHRVENQRITLADGTLIRADTNGIVNADRGGAFVGASTVAAYEEDAMGNIVRVAFVETSGSDFVPSQGTGNFNATGTSAFAIKVDNNFFNLMDGSSTVDIDVATQSGVVNADGTAVTVSAPPPNLLVQGYKYSSDVVFDTSTGKFTSSNGEFLYAPDVLAGFGPGNTNLQATNNAKLDGQVHGEIGSDANYTGLVTANTDRLEVVGTIIGHE